MKNSFLLLTLVLGIWSCTNSPKESITLSVLADKTDSLIPKPKITHIKSFQIMNEDCEIIFKTKSFQKLQQACEDFFCDKPKNFDEAIEIVEYGKCYLLTF